MKKLVLAYGFDENKCREIQSSAEKFDIDVKILTTEDLEQKIGYLMEIPGYGREEKEKDLDSSTEFMIFSDFDRQVLRDFVMDLKEKKVATPHKSVLTETNRDWKLYDLILHIEEEHRTMMKFNQLGRLVKKAQEQWKSDNSQDKNLQDAIEDCLEVPNQEITEELLDEKISKLTSLLK